jgi:hypothetical protein
MTDLETLLQKARKKGSDKKFREWVSHQPSCIDGSWSEVLESGEGRCIACHVRRAGEAGTAFKPEYSAVPMTFDQHNEQSWHGESSCLNRFIPKPGLWGNIDAKAWFDQKRIEYLTLWLES